MAKITDARNANACRRRFLRGALTASAVACMPAVVEAETLVDEGPDLKLFALLKEAKALAQRENAALDAEEAAYDRIDRPKVPEALLSHDGEELLFDQRTPEGTPYCHHDIEAMKQHLVLVERVEKRNALHALPGAETYVPRMKQIVALHAEYKAADEASIQASSYPGLKALTEEIQNVRDEVWGRIIAAPALTQAGLLAKLAFAAQHFDPEEIEGAEETADGMLISVAIDARRLLQGELHTA
jgi:hypothetical protein